MNKIIAVRALASNVNEYVIDAPIVARHARPGQFVILRVDEDGERVPFTICDIDKENGYITILVQVVGYTTQLLAGLKAGDYIHDFVGPLGNATELSNYSHVVLIGGGIGTAVIYPQAKYLASIGKAPDVIIGARNVDLLMYVDEFKKVCRNVYLITDDGSSGEKGFVTDKLKALMDAGADYDMAFAVGPMMMMRAVCRLTKDMNLPTTVSMNSIMVDGTGMCGGCRLTVGGETKYACVDGPEFDGHLVDFDEAINRSGVYRAIELEHKCRIR